LEQIFTIPVNEEFDACREKPECGCPFCKLYRRLQCDEIGIILGASMMEPDIRIQTNELGFCAKHYEIMLTKKRMLGMGLMMESHLAEVKKKISAKSLIGDPASASVPKLKKLSSDCYVCDRIKRNLDAMISTAVYLYERDDDFRVKFKEQPYFCIPHYTALLEYASKKMNKKLYADLFNTAKSIEEKYAATLEGDVSWYCKKFRFDYEEQPWYNSKDSVQRSIKFLCGSLEDEERKDGGAL
jgi:hypothetical protein